LGEVNWREIAEFYIEEYATPTESETKWRNINTMLC
jgi:hypothetical protein